MRIDALGLHRLDTSIPQRCRICIFQLCFEFGKQGILVLIVRDVFRFMYPINGRLVLWIQRLNEPRVRRTTIASQNEPRVSDFDAYLEAIVRDGGRQGTTCGGGRAPGAGAEGPKPNLGGRSLSSSQTSAARFSGSTARPRRHRRLSPHPTSNLVWILQP